jgi:hypothetical protein
MHSPVFAAGSVLRKLLLMLAAYTLTNKGNLCVPIFQDA